MRISGSLLAIMLGLSLTGSAMAGDLFQGLNDAAAKVQKETKKVEKAKDDAKASADGVKASADGVKASADALASTAPTAPNKKKHD